MQSNTASHRLLSRPIIHSDDAPPPDQPVKRVGFYGPPPEAEAALCAEVKREPANTRSGWCCWARLFCCSPSHELIDEEPIHNWKTIGKQNQHSLVSGHASGLLFENGNALSALNSGLKEMCLPDHEVNALARDVDEAIQALTLFKHDLATNATGDHRQSIESTLVLGRKLSTALKNLDEFAKHDRENPKASQLLATALWKPCSVSPDRPTGGAGPDILTPMDRFRSDLSLDIAALESLKASIPA